MRAVFVSSTFRDMQFERDALLTRVVPRMNDFLSRYAETVHFADLRWGVNTTELESEESSKKVLSVCLDQIDDCKPYMIVFVGERYGWIPSRDLLASAALLKGMEPEKIGENTSVTELEIEYGALLNPDFEGRILFYFRNPFDMSEMTDAERASYQSESELHREKVESLKKNILEKYPDFVRYYDVSFDPESRTLTGLEPLMDMIFSDLTRIFDIDLSYLASLPREERALANSRAHFDRIAYGTVHRPESQVNGFDYDDFDYYYQMRYSNNPVFEVITGEAGSGAKTVLADQLPIIEKRGEMAIPLAFGLDEFTATGADIRRALVYRLEELMGLERSGSEDDYFLADLLKKYTTVKELPYLHILLLNTPRSMLVTFHRIASKYPNLFGIAFHVHFRFPLESTDPVPFFLKNYTTEVPPLDDGQKREVVQAILASRRKQLPDIVIDEILAHEGSDKPLYISLMVERLLMLDNDDFQAIRDMGDGMDNINKYMIGLVRESGDDIADISHDLFGELCERINPDMVPHLIAHLTLRNHFNEDGIRRFFENRGWSFNSLDYTLFKKTFPSLVYESSSGYLWYTNDEVEEGAERLLEEYGMDSEIDSVLEFIDSLPGGNNRKARMRFLSEAGRHDELADIVLDGLDKPLSEVTGEKQSTPDGKAFHSTRELLFGELRDSLDREDGLCDGFFGRMVERLANGSIKYPYTVLSATLEFLIPDFSEYNRVLEGAATVVKIIDMLLPHIDESEPCFICAYILYMAVTPIYVGRVTEEWFSEFAREAQSFNRERGRDAERGVNYLISNGMLYISSLSMLAVDSLYAPYDMTSKLDNPTEEPMGRMGIEGLSRFCEAYRVEYDRRCPGLVDRLISGDVSVVRALGGTERMAYWLSFSGYVAKVSGRVEEAIRYYRAFLSLHELHIEEAGVYRVYVGHYLKLLGDALRYLVELTGEDISSEYERAMRWALDKLALYYADFSVTSAVMAMHVFGADNEYLEKPTEYFYQVWSCLRAQIFSASELTNLVEIPGYFCRFSYIFSDDEEDDERYYYYSDLFSDMVYSSEAVWSENEDAMKIGVSVVAVFAATYANEFDLSPKEVLSRLIKSAGVYYPSMKKLLRSLESEAKRRLKK